MSELTIIFRGLCLFARSKDKTKLHVFLAHPNGPDKHRSVYQHQQGTDWITDEFPPGSSFEIGDPQSTAIVTMPDALDMSSFSRIPSCTPLPEGEARPDSVGPRGSHFVLHGGELSAAIKIGIWEVAGAKPPAEYYFPYVLRWRGPVPNGAPSGKWRVWNAMEKETPKPGTNSPQPIPSGTAQQQHDAASRHFKAYFAILKNAEQTLTYKGEKNPAGLGGKETDEDGNEVHIVREGPKRLKEKAHGNESITTLVVASCPSAAIDLT